MKIRKIFSRQWSFLPRLCLLSAGVSAGYAATPLAQNLAAAHFEFSDFNAPHGYLIWQGSAQSYDVLRHIDGQAGLEWLGSVSGRNAQGQTLSVGQFIAEPIAPPTVVAHYQVVGTSRSSTATTNWVDTQEVFPDPGFNSGATTTAWTQITTGGDGILQLANFIQGEPGSCRAVLGGATSQVDEIYTSNPVYISDGARGDNTGSLTLSGSYTVTTEESSEETPAWDNLYVEIRSSLTGQLYATHQICDNRDSGKGTVRFNITLDYARTLYGTTVISAS